MASTREYLDFVLDQLSERDGSTQRKMMGEYLLYCRGKLVGGVYDDRLLIKPTPAALTLLPDAPREQPYPGAKPMLLVENVDDAAFLTRLLAALAAEPPAK